jgi:signal transduction histidine kinase
MKQHGSKGPTSGGASELRRQLQALEARLKRLQDELEIEHRLATLGELARPIGHEVNDFLNTLVLQLAVMTMDLPQEFHAGLAEVRRQAQATAALIQQFQRYSQEPAPALPADVGQVMREALETLGAQPGDAGACRLAIRPGLANESVVGVALQMAPELPHVALSPPVLRRLLVLLLRNAAAVTPPPGLVTIRAEAAGQTIVVRIEDGGPALTEEQVGDPFDPGQPGREGTNVLELAACASITRRARGTLSAENLAPRGVAIVLELAVAGEAGKSGG